jgi:hypothetical protein
MLRLTLALVLAVAAGCKTPSTPAQNAGTTGREDRDINACLKMCEVAGDAEENKGGVADCKASCER